jgi:hypothetical protein
MSAITLVVRGKHGDQVKAIAVPGNRSEEAPRFGLVEILIIAFFLISLSGLIWFLAST